MADRHSASLVTAILSLPRTSRPGDEYLYVPNGTVPSEQPCRNVACFASFHTVAVRSNYSMLATAQVNVVGFVVTVVFAVFAH